MKTLLFGAGTRGAVCARVLEARGEDYLYIDNNGQKQQSGFNGIPVLSPTVAFEHYSDATVYVCLIKRETAHAVAESLKKIGFTDIRMMQDLLFEFQHDILGRPVTRESFNDSAALRIPQLIIVITEKCSLNCRECGELVPYFEKPVDYELEELVENVQNFAAGVDSIELATVMGGEPLVYKELPELLNRLAKIPNINTFNVATNSTIIPNPQVLDACLHNITNMSLSRYGEHSHKYMELQQILDKNGIAWDTSPPDLTWFTMKPNTKHDAAEAKSRFERCTWGRGVPLIRAGRVHICGYSGASWRLGWHTPDRADYIDLAHPVRREEVQALLNKTTPCAACSLCGWGFDDQIVPGEQVGR